MSDVTKTTTTEYKLATASVRVKGDLVYVDTNWPVSRSKARDLAACLLAAADEADGLAAKPRPAKGEGVRYYQTKEYDTLVTAVNEGVAVTVDYAGKEVFVKQDGYKDVDSLRMVYPDLAHLPALDNLPPDEAIARWRKGVVTPGAAERE